MSKAKRASGASQPNGVLVIDKPRGPTSHDVVARVRKTLKTRHIGHTGTLDPMATGVLVLAIGEATKLVPWLTAADKAYEATIRLGTGTDTLDAEGTVVETAPVPAAALDSNSAVLANAIAAELARTTQVPPAYSAIRIDGVRAHELARAGRLDEPLPARPIEVRAIEVMRVVRGDDDVVEVHVRVEASKGYFVRSLARDLAIGLGTVGHLTSLRRTQSGAFTIADATSLDDLSQCADPRERLMPLSKAAARALPVTVLDAAGVRAVSFGQRVAPDQMRDPHPCPSAWLDESQRLVAIGECEPSERPHAASSENAHAHGQPGQPGQPGQRWGRVLRGFHEREIGEDE